ncbi:MAG: hypothetical protein KJ811_00160, partial [Candidatus Margulisbacteria bacterium]|nr:hypothetical protein [Candidatus Margulisiibacteriota bacterium]
NPAGFAINPGVDLAGSYQLNNRNIKIGDNSFALKGCFEIGMNPFAWIAGVGLASMFAYEGAKYLHEKGTIKKNWGRTKQTVEKDEPVAESVKEEEEEKKARGEEITRQEISKKEIAKKAVKELASGTIKVGKDFAKAALNEVANQTRHYYYAPTWYQPHYYRPSYWDDRYNYSDRENTPAGKAQFGGGLTIMTDKNESLSQNTNYYTLSIASGYEEMVALGANLNVYDLELTDLNTRGFGAGFDLGGLVRFGDKLMLGLALKELLTTDIKFGNGSTRRFGMSVNSGIAIKPIRQMTVAADLQNIFGQNGSDPTTHYGVEIRPVYGLALRAGLWDQNKTAGLSFGVGQLIVDYSIIGGSFNRTQTVSGTWKI